MSEEMQAAIAAMEARLAMQDQRIRAQHDALKMMSLEVAGMRTRLDRMDEDLNRCDAAMETAANVILQVGEGAA